MRVNKNWRKDGIFERDEPNTRQRIASLKRALALVFLMAIFVSSKAGRLRVVLAPELDQMPIPTWISVATLLLIVAGAVAWFHIGLYALFLFMHLKNCEYQEWEGSPYPIVGISPFPFFPKLTAELVKLASLEKIEFEDSSQKREWYRCRILKLPTE